MATIFGSIGQKGGVAKSTLVRALGAELARRKKEIVLIDLDIGQHTVADWVQARRANELSPELRVELVDPLLEPDFRLAELAEEFEFIVVDAPGFSDENSLQLAAQATVVLLPTGTSTDEMRPTIRLFHELVKSGIDRGRILIVLTRVGSDADEKRARDYFKQADLTPAKNVLTHQQIYKNAMDVGQAVTEVSSEGLRNKARELVAEIIKHGETVQKAAPVAKKDAAEKPKRFVIKEGETW